MDHQTPSRADVLREAAAVADARAESHTVSAVADVLRRMADDAESQRTGRMVCTPPALTTGSGCVCRTGPADGPAHESHAKWCPASHPTAERIAEIRQGTGDALTRDELYWLGGAAGRYEAHVIGARGGHWPLTDDLPGAVMLLAQYLAAAVAVIEKSQPYTSTSPSWQKGTPPGATLGSPATEPPFSSDDENTTPGAAAQAMAEDGFTSYRHWQPLPANEDLELADTTPCTRPEGAPVIDLPSRVPNGLRVLDTYSCAGGMAMGYYLAGFDVVGVDIDPQPNYPFTFIQGDAIEYIRAHGAEFDLVHGSPPCQAKSNLNAYNHKVYPELIHPTRDAMLTTGRPYVIENVEPAASDLRDPITLCGPMFALGMYRHRLFELGGGLSLTAPEHPKHVERCTRNGYLPTAEKPFMSIHGGKHSRAWQRAAAEAMGMPWIKVPEDARMERIQLGIREVCEAIPPAFAQWIGERAAQHINAQLPVAA